jgi:LPXTG-motif cell wall-anchored protein
MNKEEGRMLMFLFRAVIASVIIIAPFILNPGVSSADTTLPPGLLIGDQDGIQVDSEGDYFINAVKLMPGQVITKKLTIKNVEKGAPSFKLTMTAQPLHSEGPIDLLDKVHLHLDLDGKQLYDGRVRGDQGVNMMENALDLGRYSAGDQRVMTITLTVDKDIQISTVISSSNIRWHFYAVKEQGADPPKTGETDTNRLLWLGSTVLILGAAVAVIAKKRKKAHAS